MIPVKGEKPVPCPPWVTRHGPVFACERTSSSRMQVDCRGTRWLSSIRSWTSIARGTGRSSPRRCRGSRDRRRTGCTPTSTATSGIMRRAGLPVRKNYAGDVPVDGSSGAFEWDGYIPFEQLPSYLQSAVGLIVTANQNPFPQDYAVSREAADSRRRIARARFATCSRRTRSGSRTRCLGVQKDVYSGFELFLAHAGGAGVRPAEIFRFGTAGGGPRPASVGRSDGQGFSRAACWRTCCIPSSGKRRPSGAAAKNAAPVQDADGPGRDREAVA